VASSSREDDTLHANTKVSAAKPAKAQKIDRHDQKCNSVPDPSMPMTAPHPATPAQMPVALARSSSRWVAVNSDRVAGMMNAAPAPATLRAAMSCQGLVKIVDAKDATAKAARPIRKAPRRP
jgi:hypothetical protein